MPYHAQEWTINGLSVEFRIDRRTVAKRMEPVRPVRVEGVAKYYAMVDAAPALVDPARRGPRAFEGGNVLNLEAERARLAKEQADKTAMENGRLRGDLLPADQVTRAVTGAFARVRARMLSLPTKAAPRAVGKESLAEVQALLAGYVEEALAELAETVVDGEDVEGPESQAGEDRPGLVAGPPAAA